MGYNPYICIFCHSIEDNGWENGYHTFLEHFINDNKHVNWYNLHTHNNDNTTYDICNKCFSYILEYEKTKNIIDDVNEEIKKKYSLYVEYCIKN